MSKKLSGLHPWLRFKGHTQEQWVEWYGLDTEFIEVKAAEAYLEGEADFFEEFDEYVAHLDMSLPTLRLTSAKVQSSSVFWQPYSGLVTGIATHLSRFGIAQCRLENHKPTL
jgi:hypothetical protein